MTRRRAQIVLLCEDRQHEAFVRRFLEHSGWNPRTFRVVKSPKGRGCGEQWVRLCYAEEVRRLRAAAHVARALVAIVDEDTSGVGHRNDQLDSSLKGEGLAPRTPDEPILHIVPARNIETWLAYLRGQSVDETATYPKLSRQRECEDQVRVLKNMCDSGSLREPAPLSLQHACNEYRARLK